MCTWLSITPGKTCRPRQSITSAADWQDRCSDRRSRSGRRQWPAIAHAFAVLVDDRAALQDQASCPPSHFHQFQLALERPTSAAYVPGATRNRMKAALLPIAAVDAAGGSSRLLNGLLTTDVTKVTPAGAVRDFADAAGQDRGRLHRRRGAGRGWRRLLPRLPAGAGAGTRREAQLLQAPREGDLRGPVRGARRDGGMGRHQRDRRRPGISLPAAAGARPARDAAAASYQERRPISAPS